MKRVKKIIFDFSNYIYLLNCLLIASVLLLKFLDIYYTLILIEDSRVIETIPISQFLLNFDPIVVYAISLIPISTFFLVNHFIRKNVIYMIALSIVLIVFIAYLIPILQNSFNIIDQLNGV